MKQPATNRKNENNLIFENYTKSLIKEEHEYEWPIGELDLDDVNNGNDIESKRLAIAEMIEDLSDEQILQMYYIALGGSNE